MDDNDYGIYENGDVIEQFYPKISLVIYESNEKRVYMEMAHIDMIQNSSRDGDESLVVGTYGPVTDDLVNGIIDMAKRTERSGVDPSLVKWDGLMPKNVLFFSSEKSKINLAWYEIAQKRIYKHSKKKEISIHAPMIIYHYYDGTLFLYTLFPFARMEPKTMLYRYPVANNSAAFCLGSAEIKNFNSYEQLMKKSQMAVWDSYFTDEAATYNKIKDIYQLWKKLKGERFPKEHLLPVNTIQKLIMKS